MDELRARLSSDLKDAMRAHDEVRRETIRYLNAALKNAEIAAMHPLTDDEAEAVLVAQIKQRRDSIEQFRVASRQDLVDKEAAELAVLSAYLPAAPTDDEVAAAITSAIASTGAVGPKDMGKVVRVVLEQYPGRVDGKVVATQVRDALSNR
ncbi:MAG: GatB/YqeY [Chloroflexi bacterium]|nr:GatB/YqeY [Chloroflexota bacterium]